jgi:HEAT repeat protein
MSAAKALGRMSHWAAVSGLIDWLKVEQNELVQPWIVMSLANLGDADALPHLIEALHQTQSSTARYTIIRALGNLGDPQAITAILKYADDPDQHVRNDVVEALKKLSKESGD